MEEAMEERTEWGELAESVETAGEQDAASRGEARGGRARVRRVGRRGRTGSGYGRRAVPCRAKRWVRRGSRRGEPRASGRRAWVRRFGVPSGVRVSRPERISAYNLSVNTIRIPRCGHIQLKKT